MSHAVELDLTDPEDMVALGPIHDIPWQQRYATVMLHLD